MSIPLTINSDNQEEEEEVNADDYSNTPDLFLPDKKKPFKFGRRFSNIGNISKLGMRLGVAIIKLLVNFVINFGAAVNLKE